MEVGGQSYCREAVIYFNQYSPLWNRAIGRCYGSIQLKGRFRMEQMWEAFVHQTTGKILKEEILFLNNYESRN